ncbi:MAG: DUF4233 domain-containing protein, partial [Propionibacteriales bacterium]|nr:DUF4233 domain-containing protein [Propionibacteriales bacterium]
MLALECIVLGLLTPVLISVSGLSTPVGVALGVGLALSALVIASALRAEWAYYAGFA